ncbi:hypothetical protein DER44DRAFT_707154 [Fusarium oxysporum]|nr:hypothetical protein DER44DRAFT_707154 [Fusarium oxysporum]
MAPTALDLSSLPTCAPSEPTKPLKYVDVAVTATAKEFDGFYRNKKYHQNDFFSTLDRAREAGVAKILLTGMSLSDVEFNRSITRCRPGQCFLTVGVHPYNAQELVSGGQEYTDKLAEAIKSLYREDASTLAAFGELGLDYDRLTRASKESQIHAFKAQLDFFLSEKLDLPLFLHCRAACDDFVDIISPYIPQLPRGGLVHSFVGSEVEMQQLVALGLDVSVNGFSFANTESLKMVAAIPLDHLQIETDSPWGYIGENSELVKRYCAHASKSPQSKKRDRWDAQYMVKERNESCMIERVAFIVAGLKGIGVEEVAEQARANSIRMFGLGE